MKILAFYAFFVFALFISCEFEADRPPISGGDNTEITPGGEEPPKQPSLGSLFLMIINPDGYLAPSARTLYPDAPQFSRYVVSFLPLDNQGTEKEYEFFTDTGREFNLEAGRWGIIVQGFNGDDKAIAQGISEITVIAETNISAEIQLDGIPPDGRNGAFAWSISVKHGVNIDTYSITLSEWNNEPNKVLALPIHGDIELPPIAGSQAVPSGFYIMRASFGVGGKMFTFNEITHIYPDQTTTFTYQVTDTAFLPAISLSGSIQATATFNGTPVTPIIRRVWLYNDQNEHTAFAEVDSSGAWTTAIVKPSSPIGIRFSAELEILGHTREIFISGVTATVQDVDISGIDLSIHFPGILLQGTLVLFKDGAIGTREDGWDVKAYTDPNNPPSSSLTLSPAITNGQGEWELLVSAFDTPQNVYFSIEIELNNRKYRREKLSRIEIHNQSETNITLNGNFNPPDRVEINGTLPSLNNWVDASTLNHQNPSSSFMYSQQNLPNNGALYEITFTAQWDNPATNIEYAFDSIVGTPPAYLNNYGRGGNRGGISWLHYTADAVKAKNLLFTLDFGNDEYFYEGKPSLSIEKRGETAVLIHSRDAVFLMGSPDTEDGRNGPSGKSSETQHYVKFTRDLWVMDTEVTQSVYEELMPVPTYTSPRGTTLSSQGANYPVVDITWQDAVDFANKLSQKYGLKQVYTTAGNNVTAEWNANGWRLPTESEWEFLARAGTTTKFSTGDTITIAQANFSNVKGRIDNVASYTANSWGLYDINGNAWEFCWDFYGDYPAGTLAAPLIDPRGGSGNNGAHHTGTGNYPPPNGQRIIRGGGYACSDRYLRSAHRGVMDVERSNDIGFRLVRLAD